MKLKKLVTKAIALSALALSITSFSLNPIQVSAATFNEAIIMAKEEPKFLDDLGYDYGVTVTWDAKNKTVDLNGTSVAIDTLKKYGAENVNGHWRMLPSRFIKLCDALGIMHD